MSGRDRRTGGVSKARYVREGFGWRAAAARVWVAKGVGETGTQPENVKKVERLAQGQRAS